MLGEPSRQRSPRPRAARGSLAVANRACFLILLGALIASPEPAAGESEAYLVKDINLTAGTQVFPQWLIEVDGTLFFSAGDPDHGIELWKSDGTTAGTVLVRDISTRRERLQPARASSR